MDTKNGLSKFLILWTGSLISTIGSGLTSFGLSVYVFQKTGSAASTAIVTLSAFLPIIIIGMFAGVLADRYDRRMLMMIGDSCSAFGILYILICMLQGGASVVQICIGVFISSIFGSIFEPAFRATVSDLVSEKDYARASGLVSVVGSARYLIAPIIGGILLAFSDIKVILIIDIVTFFVTVATTGAVKNMIKQKPVERQESFFISLKQGFQEITKKRGVFILIFIISIMTCFVGMIQILSEPMILDFNSSTVLGIAETICGCGMLASSILLGIRGIKKGYLNILCGSLVLVGVGMIGFGIWENIYLICIFGFLFFFLIPFANGSVDYLIRTNISNDYQGRVWGVIGFFSQIGYIVAYASGGVLADAIAKQQKIGVGRGAATVIIIAGCLLIITSVITYFIKSVRKLEQVKQIEMDAEDNSVV